MPAYAQQAKNRDMEADAMEIRLRATRGIDGMRQGAKGNCRAERGSR